jgi:hypothetical protein
MGARGRAYRDRDSTAAVTMKKKSYANTGDKGAKRYWRIGPRLMRKIEQARQDHFWFYCGVLIIKAVAEGTPRKKAIGELADRLGISASKLEKMATKKGLDRQVEVERQSSGYMVGLRKYKFDPGSPKFIRLLLNSVTSAALHEPLPFESFALERFPPSEPTRSVTGKVPTK